jgi:hypothetical protein
MITLSPLRQYKRRIALSEGILVEIVRNIVSFLEDFKEETELTESIEKDLLELKKLTKLHQQSADYTTKRHLRNLRERLEHEMFESADNINKLFIELKIISMDDAALIYREMEEILSFIGELDKLKLPVSVKYQSAKRLYNLLEHMSSALHNFWEQSKAQSRGFLKFDEIEIKSSAGEKRRLKREDIETRLLIQGLNRKKKELRKAIKDSASSEEIHNKLVSVIETYELEFKDLEHIMHRAKVLIHRTEKLLNRLGFESEHYKDAKVKKRLKKLDDDVREILDLIQKQSLREFMELKSKSHGIAKKLHIQN